MENVRKHERCYLSYYLKVIDRENNKIIGHSVNISDSGMMLIGEEPIKEGSIFQLQMFLPREIEGSRYFEFSAICKRCQKDENPDFYNSGFELQNVSQECVQIIKGLVDKFCLDE